MAALRPQRVALSGAFVHLRPVRVGDASALFAASDDSTWTYLPYGPYASAAELSDALAQMEVSEDPLFLTIECGEPLGVASYLRIVPAHAVIEIGHIWFGVALKRTTAATEAIYLMCRHAFDDLGYRARRMEVRRPQRRVAPCCRALRVHVRGRLSKAHDREGAEP